MEHDSDNTRIGFSFPSQKKTFDVNGMHSRGNSASTSARDDIYSGSFHSMSDSNNAGSNAGGGMPKIFISDACPDVITLHTIDLLHHHRQVSNYLANYKFTNGNSRSAERAALPSETIPELPECILKHRRPGDLKTQQKISSLPRCIVKQEKPDVDSSGNGIFSGSKAGYSPAFHSRMAGPAGKTQPNGNDAERNFAQGVGVTPPAISRDVAWKILRKTVAIIFAHAGYEIMDSKTLNILTEVAEEYLVLFCSVLRKNEDKKNLTGHNVFVDVVEQTFHDIGFGSMTGLHYFYQSRIIDYHDHILRKCQEVTTEYKKHLQRFHDDPVKNEDVEVMDVDEKH